MNELLEGLRRERWAAVLPGGRRRWLEAAIKTYPGDFGDGGKEWRRRIVEELSGNPLLIIILVPLAQLLVKYLIEWILSRRENRDAFMVLHYAQKSR